jgi:hypothetical protein
MDDQPNPIGSLFETAGEYLETKVDLLKLRAVDKSAEIGSAAVTGLLIGLMITFGIFILNIGLSIWLGSLLGETWYGFFAVGGFYIVIALLLYLTKDRWIKGPLFDLIVKHLLK